MNLRKRTSNSENRLSASVRTSRLSGYNTMTEM